MFEFLKLLLRYLIPSYLIVIAVGLWVTSSSIDSQRQVILSNETAHVSNVNAAMQQNLKLLTRDILYLANSKLIKDVLSDDATSTELQSLSNQWQELMAASKMYDQIRWIDNNGQERLRLNLVDGSAIRVEESQLQNKKDRYYFKDSIGLNNDNFYFSVLDLNVEKGQIETPYKPVIRLAHTVYDNQGIKKGVVIVNYIATRLLKNLVIGQNTAKDSLWLLNQNGYWLKGSNPELEWGFMFKNEKLNMRVLYPRAWTEMLEHQQRVFETKDGYWIYQTINPLLYAKLSLQNQDSNAKNETNSNYVLMPGNSTQWKLVNFIPHDAMALALQPILTKNYWFIAFVLGIMFVGAWIGARFKLSEKRNAKALVLSNQRLREKEQQLEADIEARKQIQQTLEEGVERYEGVLSAAMDGYILMKADGEILECNSAFIDVMHLPNFEDRTGCYFSQLFEGKEHNKAEKAFDELKHTSSVETEIIKYDLDGNKMFLSVSLFAVSATQQVCAFVRDVSKAKQAEFELLMSASVFTHATEGIILTNSRFEIVDVNREFEMITGYTKQEVIGKKPSILHSGKQSPEFYQDMSKALVSKGHWYGELWNRRKTGELFLEFLTISRVDHPYDDGYHFVGMFSDITLERQYHKRLEHSAHFDALTNLPNRFLLNDRIRQAIAHTHRTGLKMAVIFVDLDGFKQVNDQFGHEVGDRLLVNVAKNVRTVLREEDTLARIGGDEFIVLVNDLESKEGAIDVCKKLLTAIAKPLSLRANPDQEIVKTTSVGASLGVTYFPQQHVMEGDQLIRQADQAMYIAKQSGKNRYAVFDTQKDVEKRALHNNLNRFEEAIHNDELLLHYQPKVSLINDEVVGVEALVRWQHPEKGLLYPGDFLSCVEHNTLAIKLSEWVISHALQQIVAWQKEGINLPVSINIGAVELQKEDFVTWLTHLMNQFPSVKKSMLEIEVLETSALADLMHVSKVIESCKNAGISFALDDFGTGFSSLSYLKKLPLDTIKIDQGFIANMLDDVDDLSILEGMIGLTKSLKRQVIAEGIESEEQGRKLIELGCPFGQGYFIARPLKSKDVPSFIKEWTLPESWRTQALVSSASLRNEIQVH